MKTKLKEYDVWFAKDVGFIRIKAESSVQARELAEKKQFEDENFFNDDFFFTEDEEVWAYCPCMIKEDNLENGD